MQNRLRELILALADRHIEFIVAGGVAAVLHGVERTTLDLDLSLHFSDDNTRLFLDVMKRFGLTPRAPVAPEILLDAAARRQIVEKKNAIVFSFQDLSSPLWHVDVFLKSEFSYEALESDTVIVDIADRKVRILSARKLLEQKMNIQPPRPKDVMDIAELGRLLEARP
jgi:hypothetical protein